MYANSWSVGSEMSQEAKDQVLSAGRGRASVVPLHVRLFARPAKGMPRPRYPISLERDLRVPMPDGTYQVDRDA